MLQKIACASWLYAASVLTWTLAVIALSKWLIMLLWLLEELPLHQDLTVQAAAESLSSYSGLAAEPRSRFQSRQELAKPDLHC